MTAQPATPVSGAVLVMTRLDASALELLVSRLQALAAVLRELVGAVSRATPAGWAGAGKQAFDGAAARVRGRLGAQAGAVEAAGHALAALAMALRSVQAEAAAAQRLQATGGGEGPGVARQLNVAEQAFDDADRRAAVLLMDALLGGPLVGPGRLEPPSVASRSVALERAATLAPPIPNEPAAVSLWWAGLSAQARRGLPADVLGGLDGIPARARDAINRVRLAVALRAAEHHYAQLNVHGFTHVLGVFAHLVLPRPFSMIGGLIDGDLARAQRRVTALRTLTGDLARPGSELLAFNARGDGEAVVSNADVDTGADVAVLVPGMSTELEDVPRLIDRGSDLVHAAGAGAVVVSWLGYDTPNVFQVASDAKAKAGARLLQRFTAGLRAAAGLRQHVTVVGHSYGTLVAGLAAKTAPIADDLVLLGSPGVETKTAAHLKVPAGHVWAARAGTDPIQVVYWPAKLSRFIGLPAPYVFGPDPAAAAFGARHFAIGGARGHSGYFTPGTQSLANLGRIVSGRPVGGD